MCSLICAWINGRVNNGEAGYLRRHRAHYDITVMIRFSFCCNVMCGERTRWQTGPRFNIKMTSYQYRKSHCGDKTILRPSYLNNGNSYTDKTTSLYWIGSQVGQRSRSYAESWLLCICVSDFMKACIKWPKFCRRILLTFSCKNVVCWFKFHWVFFPEVRLAISALIQVMVWYRTGAALLVPVMTQFADACIRHQSSLLITWMNFYPGMNKWLHNQYGVGWNYISIPKLQRQTRGMEK